MEEKKESVSPVRKTLGDCYFENVKCENYPKTLEGIGLFDIPFELFQTKIIQFLDFRDLFYGLNGVSRAFKTICEQCLKNRKWTFHSMKQCVSDIRSGFKTNEKGNENLQKIIRWNPTESYVVSLLQKEILVLEHGFYTRAFNDMFIKTFVGEIFVYPKVIKEILSRAQFTNDQIFRYLQICVRTSLNTQKEMKRRQEIIVQFVQLLIDLDPLQKIDGRITLLGVSMISSSIPLIELTLQKCTSLRLQPNFDKEDVNEKVFKSVVSIVDQISPSIMSMVLHHEFFLLQPQGLKNKFRKDLLDEISKRGCCEVELLKVIFSSQSFCDNMDMPEQQEMLLECISKACRFRRLGVVLFLIEHVEVRRINLYRRLNYLSEIMMSTCRVVSNIDVMKAIIPFIIKLSSSQTDEISFFGGKKKEDDDVALSDDSQEKEEIEDLLHDDDDTDPILEDEEIMEILRKTHTLSFQTLMSCGDLEMIRFFLSNELFCEHTDFSGKVMMEMYSFEVEDFIHSVILKGKYKAHIETYFGETGGDYQEVRRMSFVWKLRPFWISCLLGDLEISKLIYHLSEKDQNLLFSESYNALRISLGSKNWEIARWMIREFHYLMGGGNKKVKIPMGVFGKKMEPLREVLEDEFNLLENLD